MEKDRRKTFIRILARNFKSAFDFAWRRKRGYYTHITLDNYADLYMLIQGAGKEDARKGRLSEIYGFDVYRICVATTFWQTVVLNSYWLRPLDERFFAPEIYAGHDWSHRQRGDLTT